MTRSSRHFTLAALSLVCILILAACCSTSTPVLRFITISPASQSTTVGTPATFTATAYYSDGSTAPATGLVAWASSNTAVATVSGGICNPLTVGTTTISASAAGTPGATATLTVTNPAVLESITVNPPDPTVGLGGSQPFTATGNYSDNSTQDLTTQATWASSNTGAATIVATTGVATVPTNATVGASSNITATFNGVTGSAVLGVGPAVPVSLQIIATPNVTTLATGNSTTLLAQEVLSNNTVQTPVNVVAWTNTPTPAGAAGFVTQTANNSDTSFVSGLLAGNTTITATDGSLSASVTLTVVTGSTKFAYVSNTGDGTTGSFSVTAATSPYLTATTPSTSPEASVQTVISPSGQYMYYTQQVPTLWVLSVDPSTGALSTPTVTTPIGSYGPLGVGGASNQDATFIAADPYGRFVYVSNDGFGSGTGSITGYVVNLDGSLTPIGSPITGPNATFEPESIVVDGTGSYLYATNYNGNSVLGYSIDPNTGVLTALSGNPFATGGVNPYLAAMDPTGTYLFVPNSTDNSITAFKVGSGGALTMVGSAPTALTGTTATTSIFNLVVDPSASHIYALDSSGFVWGFNLGSGGAIGSAISGSPFALTGSGPSPFGGIVIDRTGKILAVDDNANAVIDIFTFGSGGALNTPSTVPTGNAPLFVTFYNNAP